MRIGVIYLGSGFGLLAIVTNEVLHRSVVARSAIAPSALLVGLGILFLTRPALAARWAQDAHSNLSLKEPSTLVITKVVGAVLLYFGLLFLR